MAKLAAMFLVLALVARLSVQQEKQKFCGRRLANTLSMLCVNGLLLEKRAGSNDVEGELAMVNFALRPWALERATRGRRKGIVEECCENSCSIDQLLDYCKPLDA